MDVKDILSIQVHPTKEEAEKGYEKETEIGIELTAYNRNFKDDNHKPELMVAISEFWLLHGFLEGSKLRKVLLCIPEFAHLISVFDLKGYVGLYKEVMEETPERTNEILSPLLNRLKKDFDEGQLDKTSPDYWAVKAYYSFSLSGDIDKGIYSIYFFNIVRIFPGEAIFQEAGLPHAYLEGQIMELMANSDNVLRGGLTPKYVDVPQVIESCKI